MSKLLVVYDGCYGHDYQWPTLEGLNKD